jgi:hypothetical protein
MAEFNPSLVTVYDVITDALYPEDLVHINAVVVKTKNPIIDGSKTFNNTLAITESKDKDLTDTTYKLFFTDKTFFYIDLGIADSIFNFREGPLDLLTGQKMTHFKFIENRAKFRMPKKDFKGITDKYDMKYLKYFLQGINKDKIDRLKAVPGAVESEIDEMLAKLIDEPIEPVDTPSGLKINFVNDGGLFKEFVRIAHDD